MNTIETGGLAFPVTLMEGKTLGDGTANGMTLRDYFIAHAPHTPQQWFKPVMPKKPNSSICISEDGQRKYENSYAAEKSEGDGWMLLNQSEIDQWEADYIKQSFVQWPAAWADAMLKARK